MSLFVTQNVNCPACAQPLEFPVNYSVNADRRPDFRNAILNGSFQQEECEHCGKVFRLEPEVTYIDVARRQWILVRPAGLRAEWPQLEEDARETYRLAYGDEAADAAREIGATLQPRVAFGWAALREKVLCAEAGIDDVALELTKLMLLRDLPDSPLGADTELRLGRADGNELHLAWIRYADETVVETLTVPRALLDDIARAPKDWQALRDEVGSGPFVDITRLLVDEVPLQPEAAATVH